MQCIKCPHKAIYHHQTLKLCKEHFLEHFEQKVFKTIKKYGLFKQGDKVCIAASGGKDSLAVLYCSMKYCREHKIDFFALAIDEGIAEYRDHTLEDLKYFCKMHEIPLHVLSFKQRFGATLDQIKEKAITQYNKKPCTVCGIFRRTLLNRGARELGATKLATGHNMDDESQSLLMNLLLGNMRHNASLGPMTGLHDNPRFVARVKPLYFMLEKETRLFAFLRKFQVKFNECPNIHLSFRAGVRDQLNTFEERLPGAKSGMINAFLEILPVLKEHYRNEKGFFYCEKCGDACSGKICNACKLEEELCINISS
ncbi:TIGR00269 family protein [Candidatus Woesearchaeota archaeon]|nr:TIGR00269 family protein [Candidatus Woesearchaeota archaeon]